MGELIDGHWTVDPDFPSNKGGQFTRKQTQFHHPISREHPLFKPESGRYHLYASYACPWAHRVLIMHRLKSLQKHIDVSIVCPDMLDNGWSFATTHADTTGDMANGKKYLYEVYQQAQPNLSTRVTVPVLWDKQEQTIVNNESSQIIRIFNQAFDHITKNHDDYYPKRHQEKIDEWNELIYPNINNGVYAAGFAKQQGAYDQAIDQLFHHLDIIDQHLEQHTYLCGETLTEADIRLIPTLLRFDPVYHTHFKCTVKRMIDYPGLTRYIKQCQSNPAISDTTNYAHIKRNYYYSHPHINPYRIIPKDPAVF